MDVEACIHSTTFLNPLLKTYTTVGIDVYPGIGEEDRVYFKKKSSIKKTEYEQKFVLSGKYHSNDTT